MDRKKLLNYLQNYSRICIFFLEQADDSFNHSLHELNFLKEYVECCLAQSNSVCFLTETMKECKSFEENQKLCTLSFNEMRYIGLSAHYVAESLCPSNILVVNQIEKFPRQHQLHLTERVLFTTKSHDTLEYFRDHRKGFIPLIIKYQPSTECFTVLHSGPG